MIADDVANKAKRNTELSAREREIVSRAAGGATDKQIADDLDLSVATLRTYWIRVRDKLGASNRTHAIAIASLEKPDAPTDTRTRLADALASERLSTWVWQPKTRRVLLDAHAGRLFALPSSEASCSIDRLLAHIWAPDRARFERFLSQTADLRPMTPIELRTGVPGDYRNLVRTVNLTYGSVPEPAVLLATTSVHVFQ